MTETLLAALTFLLFGVLWLSTQSWFDLLPRRTTRRAGQVMAAILIISMYAAPSAYQAGVQQWTNHLMVKAQDRAQDATERLIKGLMPTAPARERNPATHGPFPPE